MRDYGYDPEEATADKFFGTMRFILREHATSEFGIFQQPLPPRPARCDFRTHKQWAEALEGWQDRLCSLKRMTSVDEVDEYLDRPFDKPGPAPATAASGREPGGVVNLWH